MENIQTTIKTPIVELNKIIAEKQTIIVQQQARIRCYKHEIENIAIEAASIAEQKAEYQKLIERTDRQIEEKKQDYERLTQHSELVRWKINKVNDEIYETEKKMEELQKEHDEIHQRILIEFNDLREFFLSRTVGYEEAKALEKSNEELQKEVDRLTVEYDELKLTIKQEEEDRRKFEEMQTMKAEVDELEKRYHTLNKTMLDLIVADSDSEEEEEEKQQEEIAPIFEEISVEPQSNVDICQDEIGNAGATHSEFKLPASVCNPPIEKKPRLDVNVIQSIIIPNSPTPKRKSEETISNMVVQTKVLKNTAVEVPSANPLTSEFSHFFANGNNMITSEQADMFTGNMCLGDDMFSGAEDNHSYAVFSDEGMNAFSPFSLPDNDNNTLSLGTANNAFDFS